ncbi:MAG: PASTA domain-containing protein [Acidimicrobiia bacterium]|nr:PASTA domain-containing protein [Acidimicrobiia bacterium]
MTHDDDIPELIGRLETSLSVPDPQAIHTGLRRRKTTRKRMAGAAGTFVAALAITGGALALTGDDTTTTETASDATDARDAIDVPDAEAPVANDSGPVALQDVTTGPLRTMEWLPITAITGEFTALVDSVLLPHQYVWFDTPTAGSSEVTYSTGCRSVTHVVEWKESGFVVVETLAEPAPLPATPFSELVSCSALAEQVEFFVPDDEVTVDWGSGFTRFSVDSTAHGLYEFELGPSDPVIVMPSVEGLDFEGALLRLFELGLQVTQVEEATGEVEQGVVIRTDPPAGTALDERSTVTLVTSAGPSFPDDPSEGPPATVATAPPSFSPQPGAELSGQWTVIELWSDGARIDLDSFPGTIPSITLDGKTLSGHDGCNGHGNGLFLPSADGSIQIQSGRTTLVGCPENAALTAFSQGAINASQWGLSPSGHLVLANGPVVVVFERTGPLPQ